MSLPLKLLVDTNVWIDYFLERRPEAHEAAMGFVAEATAADAVLYTSSATMPDLFFLPLPGDEAVSAGARQAR